MAKLESLFDLRRTFGEWTVVNTRRNGKHVRAARGTHKEAKLNEACERERKNLMNAVTPAKILKDALDPYRQDFKDGGLWSRLMSLCQRHIREHGAFDFSKIEPIDLYPDYSFDRLVNSFECNIVPSQENDLLHLNLSWQNHRKARSRNVDGYHIKVIGIFPDIERTTADTSHVDRVVTGTGAQDFMVQLPIPPSANAVVICVRMEASVAGKAAGIHGNTGMKVLGGQKC